MCVSQISQQLPELVDFSSQARVDRLEPCVHLAGGVAFLGETLTLRLAGAGAAVIGGVAVALAARR